MRRPYSPKRVPKDFLDMFYRERRTEEKPSGEFLQWAKKEVIRKGTLPFDKFVPHFLWMQDKRSLFLGAIKLPALLQNLPENAQVASLGCGIGVHENFLASRFPSMRIECMDNEPLAVDRARKIAEKMNLKNVSFVQGAFLKSNLHKSTYDCLFSFDAFHWENNVKGAVSEMKSLLKPSGPGKLFIFYRTDRKGHVKPPEVVKRELAKQGFGNIKVERFGRMGTSTKMVAIEAELKK